MSAIETKLDIIIKLLSTDLSWIQNIISTTFGIILGYVLTLFSQNSGKLKIFYVSHEVQYANHNRATGEHTNLTALDDFNSCQLDIVLDIHNSSFKNIGMRNTKIVIKGIKDPLDIKDLDSLKASNNRFGVSIGELETMNIVPHEIKRVKMRVYPNIKDKLILRQNPHFYFCYTDNKNISRETKLSPISI